jgi:hypothetical protein
VARFIKIFYGTNTADAAEPDGPAPAATVATPAAPEAPPAPVSAATTITAAPVPARASPVKAASTKRQEVLQMQLEIQRKQEALLAKAIDEQKRLLAQLQQLKASAVAEGASSEQEASAAAAATRTDLMKRLRDLAAVIADAKADAPAIAVAAPSRPIPGTRGRGALVRGRARGRGRGAVRAAAASFKLDNRPVRLVVAGLPPSHRASAAVKAHFGVRRVAWRAGAARPRPDGRMWAAGGAIQTYGAIAQVDMSEDGTSAVVTFAKPSSAELVRVGCGAY